MIPRAACVALCAFVLGCMVDDPEIKSGCDTLADCPLGKICDVRIRTCVPERTNWFSGRFTCRVLPAGERPTELLGSELIGDVDTDRYSLPIGATCHHTTSDKLSINFLPVAGPAAFDIYLDWAGATQGGSIKIWAARYFGESDTASLWEPDLELALGYSRNGSVRLWQGARDGAVISGFVDIGMTPVKGSAAFGIPCPQGVADCGKPLPSIGGAACLPFDAASGATHDVCSFTCASNADCEVGDGVCSSGFCTRPCSSNGDCSGDLACLSDSSGGPSGCF